MRLLGSSLIGILQQHAGNYEMDWKGLLLWVDLVLLSIPAALIIRLAMVHGVSAADTATLPASQPPSSSLQQGELRVVSSFRRVAQSSRLAVYSVMQSNEAR